MASISEKADHVRAAVQTRGHTCHWPGCDQQVPPAMWGCKRHWYKLPMKIRNRIWREYRIGQEADRGVTRDYVSAAQEAQNWIAANGG